MITTFISSQLQKAKYKLLADGTYWGEIPGLKGVWSNAKRLEDCREELREVLEGWLVFKLKTGEHIHGFNIKKQAHQSAQYV